MNIGINASFLRKPHTGIGQVTTHFLNTLIEQNNIDKSLKNHKFFLYCEEECDFELPRNFTVRAFLPFYKRDDLFRKLVWEKFMVPSRARRDKCDVLISLYQSATVIHYTDMKHVMIVHDIIPRIFPEYLDNLRKKIHWNYVEKGIYAAHNIITVSEHTKSDLEQRLNVRAGRTSVAPISVDKIFDDKISDEAIDRVMEKYDLSRGEYIYTGGGLELRKDVERTLRAYKILTEEDAHVPSLVVSGKLMPELAPLITDVEKVVRDLGIEQRVKILGFVEQDDLPALYAGAKFFIYPSLYEGFGMPVLEAMNVGAPVITTKDTSIHEVGADAVMYTEHDDQDLKQKMATLISDVKLREELRAAGLAQSKNFSWESFVVHVRNTIIS